MLTTRIEMTGYTRESKPTTAKTIRLEGIHTGTELKKRQTQDNTRQD
jgi:hypothetical protein